MPSASTSVVFQVILLSLLLLLPMSSAQRHFLVFYHYPNSHTGPSPFDESPYDVYGLEAPRLPPMAVIQGKIAQAIAGKLHGSVYHIRITGITEVTRAEFDNFSQVDTTDALQQASQHPPRYPGDCVLL
jgi:hypothetical protein